MKITTTKHAGYLEEILNPKKCKQFAKWAKDKLLEIHAETPIDAIVVTGTSGLLLGPILSYLTGIPIMVVRKEADGSHSSTCVEANFSVGDGKQVNLVVVDDLISSGTTMQAINKTLCDSFNSYARYPGIKLTYAFRGILLYANGRSSTSEQKTFTFKENPLDHKDDLCDCRECKVYAYED